MRQIKIALIGAGSRSFGRQTITDVLLSDVLQEAGVELVLMDRARDRLAGPEGFSRRVCQQLGRSASITATDDLDRAVDGADFVVAAIEQDRELYWSMDFHIPRKHGFKQVYGENGGPGGMFHALRNMGPMVHIARTMEHRCPDAMLLNFTNPEHKTCQAITRLTRTRTVGLCHGVFMGLRSAAMILNMPVEDLDAAACGINHFTWFQSIRHAKTGQDLYPALRERERQGDWLTDWHEIGLGRILLRVFGLWPSPGANHYGEYLAWADEFVASELQYFYDPAEGHPWQTGNVPRFVYTLNGDLTHLPWLPEERPRQPEPDISNLKASGELAVPIIEAIGCGIERELAAVNVPNKGRIPGLPDDLVVEVPARVRAGGLQPRQMQPLPEPIAALIRTQASIHTLLVDAFAERSREKLLQAVLLDPTVNSYRRAVEMVQEMCRLQAALLPFDGDD